MTEEEAQAWLSDQGWWDGPTGDRLRTFVDLVLEEAGRQNLISVGTKASIWARHIVDSAQLLTHAVSDQTPADGLWLDLGTGAGFPGLVIGCLREAPIRLVEVRPLRVAFLKRCAEALDLGHVEVVQSKVESAGFDRPAAVISARAYAPLDRLLATAHHLADENTIWLLPKGRSSEKELEIVQPDWQAVFHVEQSVTDAESAILTVRQLKKRVPVRATDKKPVSSRRNGKRRKAAATSARPKGQS
ncbi:MULTISPECIES: 16S rRNA (guanine(527)-N(7))-methyltransferase RsmG [Sphingobium]|uniref:16S rRNA (guanine(527)-N(7))-methyltransferase RsmG n=1 Tax=Sphingobium TaxID=165695 RepID=UPI0015EB9C8D|nr:MULTISPECIES: 16S rRNA (guanine(527)-N(7))-methyltransferase RsmG [Sphingobium]MCW2363475.1 16S rRNA (guanine527-N7)-methyltransferase [Sphingobium sp. B10D3B]MCW2403126.1 16S rRNA (guanine527-N7)-methyltransferase [Sphingobium sp. B10D7B]MCW2410105.1 16S rRNA (guanine527-N7)-methyltransferase [Sphingobium xanthum]